MFRVNRKTDYAIRVMLSLAKRPKGARLSAQVIQAEMLIPRAILQRIIADLSRSKLVNTFPGPGGGSELARPAATITLRNVWEAIEGPLLISDCLKAPAECPLDVACPVQARWSRLQSLVMNELEATTLAHLASEAVALSSDPAYEYRTE